MKLNIFSASLIATVFSLVATQAQAAEKVILKYRFLRESISVPELTTFAETGELSSSLNAYLGLANKEPDDLEEALTKEVKVNAILLSKILNTTPGEMILDQLSEVIHTPTQRASRQSLRSALVKSALPDGKITLLEVLQNYPTQDVIVEGERLAEALAKIEQLTGLIPNIRF
ncbi:MAG: alpha/beta hydrolase [Spirulinaceae cyanobacterium]